MRGVLCVLFGTLLLAGTAAAAAASNDGSPERACEPAAVIDLSVKTISLTDKGRKPRIVVELTLTSSFDLPLARVEGSLTRGTAAQRESVISDLLVLVRSKTVRKKRYELELERGMEHHIIFTLSAEDESGTSHESTTYLKLNLNPDLEPEDLGNLLQFRTRPEGN